MGFVAAVPSWSRPEDAPRSGEPLGLLPGCADLWSNARQSGKKGFRLWLENPKERSCGV